MSRYCVTGGAGFVGSALARELVRRQEDVVVFDNFSSGTRENLADIADDITVIEGDIRDTARLAEAFKNADYVLHQAALIEVARSMDDPLLTHEINVTGTLNVLMSARDAKVKRVVLASSAAVYGNVKRDQNSETDPLYPASPYAASKLAGELYAQVFTRAYGLETVCLRYFNIYGPGQRATSQYSLVIPLLMEALTDPSRTPEIHGQGNQTRDFVHIDDVVQANLLAVRANGIAGESFNIGSGEAASINDLYELLQNHLSIHKPPRYGSRRPGDIDYIKADISKAIRLLRYRPTRTLPEGIAQLQQKIAL